MVDIRLRICPATAKPDGKALKRPQHRPRRSSFDWKLLCSLPSRVYARAVAPERVTSNNLHPAARSTPRINLRRPPSAFISLRRAQLKARVPHLCTSPAPTSDFCRLQGALFHSTRVQNALQHKGRTLAADRARESQSGFDADRSRFPISMLLSELDLCSSATRYRGSNGETESTGDQQLGFTCTSSTELRAETICVLLSQSGSSSRSGTSSTPARGDPSAPSSALT